MKTLGIQIRALFVLALATGICQCVAAQAYKVRPVVPRVKPQLILGGTLTVSATPAAVSFALVHGGVAAGSSGVTITTTWNVIGIGATLDLYGYFTSSTAALTDGRSPADLIPSSAVLGQVTTGVPTTYTPFTQTAPFGAAGAGLELVNESFGFTAGGNRTDVLNLEINLSGVPKLPAGTYTGTLTLQATMD
jgi:hypothetical protein